MPSVTIQDFHADVHAAELASERGPLFITEEGQPRRVLLDILEYRKLAQAQDGSGNSAPLPGQDLATLLAIPESEYFDWEPPRLEGHLFQAADLS